MTRLIEIRNVGLTVCVRDKQEEKIVITVKEKPRRAFNSQSAMLFCDPNSILLNKSCGQHLSNVYCINLQLISSRHQSNREKQRYFRVPQPSCYLPMRWTSGHDLHPFLEAATTYLRTLFAFMSSTFCCCVNDSRHLER